MKRTCLAVALLFVALSSSARAQEETIRIDANAASHPFPHFWEQMFGSGRAVLSLRDDYRRDLKTVKDGTGFRYIRFHGILDNEVGVYDEDAQGNPVYNFSYVDQIYDGLLANGVRPYVELSFMPNKLAAHDIHQAFWYKPNVSPPKDWNRWENLVYQFASHVMDRYGIDEVSKWYFEVWNEPNIDFLGGEPKQATYWQLYDHAAAAIKRVRPQLGVGGPATAQAAWADEFIRHCVNNHVPVDFVSTHVYGNDTAENVFGTHEKISRDHMVCRAVKKVHDQITASALPKLPLIWSEFNASYMTEPAISDSIYMGPWMADTIRQCDGLVNEMSYWTFSDVFEEQGVVKQPFYGGYGLVANGGLPKPSYNAFKVLHLLGDRRLTTSSDSALATTKSGLPVLAAWNLVLPGAQGSPKTVTFQFVALRGNHNALIYRVDATHGSLLNVYQQMGSPQYPTQSQIETLRKAAELPPPEQRAITGNQLSVDLPAQSLAIIEVK